MPHRKSFLPAANGRDRWLLRVGAYASLVLGLSVIALVWIGASYFTQGARKQAEQSAFQNASNLSRAFEEQIIRSISTADQTLHYVRNQYARDPDHFDMSLWSRDSEYLTGISFQVAIIGKDGRMIASSIPGAKPGLDLSDREHFKIHTMRMVDELFISKPVFGRVSNKWSIQLTRRIDMPDGSFGEVAVVSIDPDYLSQFYKSIDVGDGGSVTLVGTDGIVRARGTNGPSVIGRSLINSELFRLLDIAETGVFAGRSELDGRDGLFAYRAVRNYPLVVVVGLAKDEVLRTYESNRRDVLPIAAILTLWLLGVTVLMWLYERSLARARDAAEAGTRARSKFLALMSHEIRTPMNGVVGMSEALIDSGLNAEQLGHAKMLRESASHLLQLINDVLDFSKLEADRVEIEQIAFDVAEVVRSSVGILSSTARDKDLTLTVDISPDVPRRVVGDPSRLRQVMFNMVGNALKFTQEGGITVKVELDGQPMKPGFVRLAFTIADTGIGIPKEAIPLLFREFSQLDSSIARRFGGSGLGLAICRRLVALMGGKIKVESELGKGTTFSFTIDFGTAAAEPVEVETKPPAVSPAAAGRLRILLVEDNKTNQAVAISLLKRFGHVPEIANTGEEAVAKCRTQAYDVVLMDVMMPGMDGPSATREIRKLAPPFGSQRIVALTANTSETDREMCLTAGMDDFLAKPVTRAGLAAKLADAGALIAAAAPAADPAPPSDQAPVFDKAVHGELRDAIGDDGMAIALDSFLTDTPERIALMRRAARDGVAATTKNEVHAIKSSSASLGFMHLSALAKALERDCLGLAWPALDARIGDIAKAYAEADILARAARVVRFRFHRTYRQE